jgi:hypothetical protein
VGSCEKCGLTLGTGYFIACRRGVALGLIDGFIVAKAARLSATVQKLAVDAIPRSRFVAVAFGFRISSEYRSLESLRGLLP